MQHIFVICNHVWVLRAPCSSFRQGFCNFCLDVSVFRAPCSSFRLDVSVFRASCNSFRQGFCNFCLDVSVFRAPCSSFSFEDSYEYLMAGGTCKSDRNLSLSEFW
ncbi:hypothetical protein H6G93_14450 [Nostoc sp. FACHB-973]|nr:hypothetical protein [Nostoc sp. FACHB-973]